MNNLNRRVVVIGGGVAGITAAIALADVGMLVELIEKRPFLGGRASSSLDKHTHELVDECQHGTMHCCTNLSQLLDRLGVLDKIDYHRTIEFLDSEGNRSAIHGSRLPAPLHTAPSFLRFKSLGIRDKIGIARAMLLMLISPSSAEFESLSIDDWFKRTGQTERAIKRFWRPILVSACNEELHRISCYHGFKILRDGFLLNSEGYQFGVPSVPLGALYTEPTITALQQNSGVVRTKTTVESIQFDDEDRRVLGVILVNGEQIPADYIVCALQSDLLWKILPESIRESYAYFKMVEHIEFSPICGVHLWFDRAVDCPPALALLDCQTEWVFNKTKNFKTANVTSTYLSTVVSASRMLSSRTKEEILEETIRDLQAALPSMKGATLLRWQVVRWPKATFSPIPGVEGMRPVQKSPIKNLYIAGEWTQTGWPSTMESAARSGYLAAEALLIDKGSPKKLLAADSKPGRLAHLLDGHRRLGKHV